MAGLTPDGAGADAMLVSEEAMRDDGREIGRISDGVGADAALAGDEEMPDAGRGTHLTPDGIGADAALVELEDVTGHEFDREMDHEDIEEQAVGVDDAGQSVSKGWGGHVFKDEETDAASRLSICAEMLWELEDAPLGPGVLHAFGQNGPPMNILDVCPETDRLFVANQRQLLGLSIEALAAQAVGSERIAPGFSLTPLNLNAQANRVRCGRVCGKAVAVAVDARGGVTVVQTAAPRLCSLAPLLNTVEIPGADRSIVGVSTWGIAIAGHGLFSARTSSSCDVVVSGNDHQVKAWAMAPPTDSLSDSWAAIGCSSQGRPQPSQVIDHSANIPSIDLVDGRIVAACLDGNVIMASVSKPTSFRGSQDRPAVPGQFVDASLAADNASAEPLRPLPAKKHLADGIWNVCWVPLSSICSLAPPGQSSPSSSGAMNWSLDILTLPGQIIYEYVLPFFTAQELMSSIQLLSTAHFEASLDEVHAGGRAEHMILCLSKETAWLLDSRLNVRGSVSLPFDATFAHVSYEPGLSTAFVATKFEHSLRQIWAIILVRRRRSLNFRLQLDYSLHTDVEAEESTRAWPHGVVVGMAAAKGRLYALMAGRHLSCREVSLRCGHAWRLRLGPQA